MFYLLLAWVMYYLYTRNERLAVKLLIVTYEHRRSTAKSERWVHNLLVDPVEATYLMSLDGNSELMQPLCILILSLSSRLAHCKNVHVAILLCYKPEDG